MNRIGKVIVCIIVASLGFGGCGFLKMIMRKKKEKALPRMVVLPFSCENDEVGMKMTESFVLNITKKIEAMNHQQFETLISSLSTRSEGRYTGERAPDSSDPSEEEVEPMIHFSTGTFFRDLVNNQHYRTKVRLEFGVEYAVQGSAKEKVLGELELGNLITAETAQMEVFELREGSRLMKSDFKQGFFEIIAPERIGKKFATQVNKKLKRIRKADRRKTKMLKKKYKN